MELEGTKDCSVPDLISFLKSAFRDEDFAKAESMLRSKEEKRLEELEGFRIRCGELEGKSEEAEEGFRALTAEIEKKERECSERVKSLEAKMEEMESRKVAVLEELEKRKSLCCEMERRIALLEGDHEVVCGREQRAQEKIARLEMEMKRKEQENKNLECGKRRAENEIADYKRRCGESEVRVLQLEEENSQLRGRELNLCEKMKVEVEPKELLHDSDCEERTKQESRSAAEHENEVVHAFVDVESACHSPVRESTRIVRAATLATSVPSESFGIVDVVDLVTTEKDHMRQVRQKLLFNEEESSDEKNMPVKVNCAKSTENVVLIIDSDDEMEIVAPMLCHNVRNSGFEETCRDMKGPTSPKSVRMHSDPEAAVEENASSSEENITLCFTPKRKHPSKVITSDNEGDDEEDDDDKVPLSKLKMKKLADVTDRSTLSPLQLSGKSPTISSVSDNVEESITPLRRRIISLRQCEETKRREKRSNPSHSIGENLSSKTDSVAFGTSNISYHTRQKPAVESHLEEDESEQVDSDSEGESLDGFIVQESDGSESEGSSNDSFGDEAENGLALNQILDSIRKKKNTSKWEYEADMLSSFAKDPELCMKAVCALYRQQTSDEQSTKGSFYANNRGFNKFDALRGSILAEFLTDGDPHGPLKKSLEELEKHDPRAREYCYQLATRYSKQLFEIYRNEEDPHFLPCC